MSDIQISQSQKILTKKSKKKRLRLKHRTMEMAVSQCVSCGTVIDNGEYCDDLSCRHVVRRYNSTPPVLVQKTDDDV